MMSEDQDYTKEQWMFAGTRTLNGKKVHAWLPLPAGDSLKGELLYQAKGSHAVGGNYEVEVAREGERISLVNNPPPRYLGRNEDTELRALAEMRHLAAETSLRVKRMESADKRGRSLDEALEPLVSLSSKLHPTERTAFAAYVLQRITKPW